ncbi:MAG: D-beta-hydroxybutyrate dehydrogenase [Candidatus Gottesmanbacteria bacterium GW2011_GWC2_39_8]|uniref:D-beta-hydroxybutyrate dehydrogenase n=1 Tax=Candidatus Gottesmanbacteria bacterium GW2011_GWC2_39_8 TaxID=1618450 RepID=A0A0G0PTQ9_9BACT|nr:MAG: D-beta-hydroxybutyrate dehydrogenase [Candidatus Gottesmanbacteria bacterium GW2011_GWC2_39_8]
MDNLKGKVVVITGGSEGLGKAVALELAEKGAKLALIARGEQKLKQAVEELSNKTETNYYICDVSNPEAVGRTIDSVVCDFGTIDILVNNAGVYYEDEDCTSEKTVQMFGINTLGVVFVSNKVVPIMQAKNKGQIFNVISVAGVEPGNKWGIYAATKYAVRGFTDSLSQKLIQTNVRVMGFYPNGMDTNIFDAAGYNFGKDYGWMMKKENIAKIILFMLSQPDDMVINHLEVRKVNEKT